VRKIDTNGIEKIYTPFGNMQENLLNPTEPDLQPEITPMGHIRQNILQPDVSAPQVTESTQRPDLGDHFPTCRPLISQPSDNIKLKYIRKVPKQREIDKFRDILNQKCLNSYNLPHFHAGNTVKTKG